MTDLIQKTLDSYSAGIEIVQVQLQKVDPPGKVIDAFRDVQAARADQVRLQNEANAYANRVVPEARGQAERPDCDGDDSAWYRGTTCLPGAGYPIRIPSLKR